MLIITLIITLSLAACLNTNKGIVSRNPVSVPITLSEPAGGSEEEVPQKNQNYGNAAQSNAPLLAQFQAIDVAITTGEYAAAQQQLNQIAAMSQTDPAYRANFILLHSKLALLTGRPSQSLFWLEQIRPPFALNPEQNQDRLHLLAQALYRTNQVLLSAIARIESAAEQDPTQSRQIWQDLLSTAPDQLTSEDASPLVTGWLAIARIAQNNANNFPALQQKLHAWQVKYPQHPAAIYLEPAAYSHLIENTGLYPTSVGVILPLSGHYAVLGNTLQHGLLAAYYAHSAYRPDLYFYDSATEKMAEINQQIASTGNTLVLGPLTKNEAEVMLHQSENNPQRITLNYTAEKNPKTHLEFGIAPEEEARQIAQLAWRLGKQTALIITPKSKKGQETAAAFEQQWRTLGGYVQDTYAVAREDNVAKNMASFLGVSDSRLRQQTLRSLLKKPFKGNDYFRHDADMIFLVADPKLGRQIRPFISFYSGNYFSVFATSSIYTGESHPDKDKDLNEVYFCDMPGLFQKNPPDRLALLGQDAYLLAMQQTHLLRLPQLPLLGVTGQLTVDPDGKIKRELMCAQFKDGIPTPLK